MNSDKQKDNECTTTVITHTQTINEFSARLLYKSISNV